MLFLIMVTRATSFFSQCHSMSRVLFSDDSDDEGVREDVQLTINEHYASAFEYRKEREELERRNVDFSPFRSHTQLIIRSSSEVWLGLRSDGIDGLGECRVGG